VRASATIVASPRRPDQLLAAHLADLGIGLDTSWYPEVLFEALQAVLQDSQAQYIQTAADEGQRPTKELALLSHHQYVSAYAPTRITLGSTAWVQHHDLQPGPAAIENRPPIGRSEDASWAQLYQAGEPPQCLTLKQSPSANLERTTCARVSPPPSRQSPIGGLWSREGITQMSCHDIPAQIYA
jgi:hypothetical protein